MTCVGLKGAGGLLDLSQAITSQPSTLRTTVIVDGHGLRYSRRTLRHEWETSAYFREAAALETQSTVEAMQDWCACAARHPAPARLASLLLWMTTPGDADLVYLSQDIASRLLNVRRPTATTSAAPLERVGAIAWQRGSVRILDRPRLIAVACAWARQAGFSRSRPSASRGVAANVRPARAGTRD